MKEGTSEKRSLSHELSIRTVIDEMTTHPFTSREMIGVFLTFYFAFFSQEMCFAFFFNSKDEYVGNLLIQSGDFPVTDPIFEKIEQTGSAVKAKWFVLAHNHISVPPVPSAEDTVLTSKYRRYFADKAPELREHFIVSGSDFATMFTETLWNKRYDGCRNTLF